MIRHLKASYTGKAVKKTIEELEWETVVHATYSPVLAPADYYVALASMGDALIEHRFTSDENARIWIENWFAPNLDVLLARNPQISQ